MPYGSAAAMAATFSAGCSMEKLKMNVNEKPPPPDRPGGGGRSKQKAKAGGERR